jgi:antitoxin component YwqK of YwqJK toxin-antitoxin module
MRSVLINTSMRTALAVVLLLPAADFAAAQSRANKSKAGQKTKLEKKYTYNKKTGKVTLARSVYEKDGQYIEHGKEKAYYRDGTIKRTTEFAHGVKHGGELLYYPNGNPKSKTLFVEGVRHGVGTMKYANGQPKERGNLVDDHKQGVWKYWHEDGSRYRVIVFNEGNRHGDYKELHLNGEVAERGMYTEDKRDGKFTAWYDDGKKRLDITYVNGKKSGIQLEWYRNEQQRSSVAFDKDMRHGTATWWNREGELMASGAFRNDKPNSGTIVELGEDDSHWFVRTYVSGEVTGEILHEDGKPKNGLYIEWHAINQKKRECTYKDGKRHGVGIQLYESGAVMSRCTWVENKIDGTYTEWFENGRRRWEIVMRHGSKEGEERSWDGLGNLVAEGENRFDLPWNGTVLVVEGGENRWGAFLDGAEIEIKLIMKPE